MSIKRQDVDQLRQDLNEKLALMAKEKGLSVKIAKATYNESNMRFDVEFSVIAENGIAMTNEARNFIARASALGMKPTDLGRRFLNPHTGRIFEFSGYMASRPKFPFMAKELATGTYWKFTETAIKGFLGYEVK